MFCSELWLADFGYQDKKTTISFKPFKAIAPYFALMSRLLLQCLFLIFLTQLFHLCHGDVGTASRYNPPYLPTACYGNDVSQFPPNNMFASASEGIWDNGASCGRQYLVRCLSAEAQGTCIEGQTILIRIVDRTVTAVSRPKSNSTTMVLSDGVFSMIADPSLATQINIEFQQV